MRAYYRACHRQLETEKAIYAESLRNEFIGPSAELDEAHLGGGGAAETSAARRGGGADGRAGLSYRRALIRCPRRRRGVARQRRPMAQIDISGQRMRGALQKRGATCHTETDDHRSLTGNEPAVCQITRLPCVKRPGCRCAYRVSNNEAAAVLTG